MPVTRTFAASLGSAVLALLTVPSILWAGANSWTDSRPTAETFILVAADPADPYVVYGTFGGALYRSGDGGRTWDRLEIFSNIQALLVHPASPATIYVSGYDPSRNRWAVFKSLDSGNTWSPIFDGSPRVLAGSPTDPSTLFVGDGSSIYKTTDAGATWTKATDLPGVIASLVIDRREPATAYAGAEGYEYFGSYPGSLAKTIDGGVTWRDTAPHFVENVSAVAVDHIANSTVYAALGPYMWSASTTPWDVLRSEDAGATWASAGKGLPGSVIRNLLTDPRISGTLYAGTDSGVYRSRDGGRSWTPFGQSLAGSTIGSLSIADDGRHLHASTSKGVFNLEIASGPLDVSGAGGGSRVLYWSSDRLAVGTLDASGHWTRTPFEDSSATWTATAIAEGGDGLSRVLWQGGDGRSALEIVGPAGRQSATVFAALDGWIASDLAVRSDGGTDVMWTNANGAMRVARVESSGVAILGPEYGPTNRWSAVAIADGPAGATWALWRSTDGRSALSLHHEGVMVSSFVLAASVGWTAEDVAVGADGRPRLLRVSPDGSAEVSKVDAAGRLTELQVHGSPGHAPRRIAAGSDGLTRLLFSAEDGSGALFLLDAHNTKSTQYAIPVE